MEKLILIGGGSHCASVIDSIRNQGEFEPVGILDLPQNIGQKILGIPIVGHDIELKEYRERGINYAFISMGSVGDVSLRKKLMHEAKKAGFKLATVIDPTAIIGGNVNISDGVFVGKGAIINVNTKVRSNSIINSGTIIEHDCKIGDFVHVAPGTTLSGGVTIGDDTHIGTNTTIIQGVSVGNQTIIGAGSVVVRNIASGVIAYGNPCREVRK